MPEVSLRFQKTLAFHQGEVLDWVTTAATEQKLAFLESYLIGFTVEELESCVDIIQYLLEKRSCATPETTYEDHPSVVNHSQIPTLNTSVTESTCRRKETKAEVTADLKSANSSMVESKLSSVKHDVGAMNFKKEALGWKEAQKDSRVIGLHESHGDVEVIREVIKSSFEASWLVEENIVQLFDPIADEISSEGYEVVIAFRVDDTKSNQIEIGVNELKLPEAVLTPGVKSEPTKKRKRKAKGSKSHIREGEKREEGQLMQQQSNTDVTDTPAAKILKNDAKIGSSCSMKTVLTPTYEHSNVRDLPCSPPAKKPKILRKGCTHFIGHTAMKVLRPPAEIPVHKGLMKIKIEKDFRSSVAKSEPG